MDSAIALTKIAFSPKDAAASARRIKAQQPAGYLDNYVRLIGWQAAQKETWTKGGFAMFF
jgi:hypothetical protein